MKQRKDENTLSEGEGDSKVRKEEVAEKVEEENVEGMEKLTRKVELFVMLKEEDVEEVKAEVEEKEGQSDKRHGGEFQRLQRSNKRTMMQAEASLNKKRSYETNKQKEKRPKKDEKNLRILGKCLDVTAVLLGKRQEKSRQKGTMSNNGLD
jgi:hypothetical protein